MQTPSRGRGRRCQGEGTGTVVSLSYMRLFYKVVLSRSRVILSYYRRNVVPDIHEGSRLRWLNVLFPKISGYIGAGKVAQ